MNNTSLDLSDKIDPQISSLLATIKQTAESLGMPFFVIGATARDMILEFGYAIPTGRMKQHELFWSAFGEALKRLSPAETDGGDHRFREPPLRLARSFVPPREPYSEHHDRLTLRLLETPEPVLRHRRFVRRGQQL